MKWKLLVAIFVVFAILGLLFFTEQGKKYAISLGSLTRSLITPVGNFIGSFLKIPLEKEFNLELNLNREAIYGQTFSFSGFEASGKILSLKMDGKTWEIGENVKIGLAGEGEISIGNDGMLKLKANANLLQFDSLKTNNVKIEMEMIPENFSVNDAKADLLNMSSASGNASKKLGDIEVKVDFEKANLEIENFLGKIEFEENLRLVGTANNMEINRKRI
jgi:hypothetical protein